MPDQPERPTTEATLPQPLRSRVPGAGGPRLVVDDGSHGWSPDDLVTEHLWLVDRLAANAARRFPAHTDRHDLWSAGVLGLVEASRRYDPTEGVPFAAFASARVRGQIIDQVRSRDLASRRLRRILRVVVRASEFLAQHLGRVPTLEEISQASGMPIETVREALDDLATLTDPASIDESSVSIDGALVDRAPDPGEQLAETELVGTLREAVERLPEPLRAIVQRSYWEGARLQDIATDMGITFQRVAQYRTEALAALNAWFSQLYDELDNTDDRSPGRARRAAYCASMSLNSSWRARLAAGHLSPEGAEAALVAALTEDGDVPGDDAGGDRT
jgi:RNA polymerase sigma factor FliA